MAQVEPVEFGWTNVRGFPLHGTEEDLRPDAGRYECGTLNTVGCFGLKASIELFLEAGVEAISEQVLDLTDRIAGHVADRGYELAAPRGRTTGSGIVSFRKHGVDAEAVRRRLAANRVSVSARKGYIRASPHFYNSESEIERFLALLED